MAGTLRVSVIGAQTCYPNSRMACTVYRTSVNYRGVCYHRLIRYRQFRSFAKHVKLSSNAAQLTATFPPKLWWSRKASLRPEIVEARQVLLNEYMQEVCSRPMTPSSGERLRKLLKVGEFAPTEEEDRVIDSRVSTKRLSHTLTDPTSEQNQSFQSEMHDHVPKRGNQVPQDSLTDEEEDFNSTDGGDNNSNHNLQLQTPESSSDSGVDPTKSHANQSMVDKLQKRRTSRASSDPVSDDMDSLPEQVSWAPLKPEQHVTFAPSELKAKEGERESIGNWSDTVSTPESHYRGPILQCIASIEQLMDDSRKFETCMREKQAAKRPMEGHVV